MYSKVSLKRRIKTRLVVYSFMSAYFWHVIVQLSSSEKKQVRVSIVLSKFTSSTIWPDLIAKVTCQIKLDRQIHCVMCLIVVTDTHEHPYRIWLFLSFPWWQSCNYRYWSCATFSRASHDQTTLQFRRLYRKNTSCCALKFKNLRIRYDFYAGSSKTK